MEKCLQAHCKAQLRGYQMLGVAWLDFLNQLQLGGILADDMGLGKTIQVIALLVLRKVAHPHYQALLVVPASLLGNWKKELIKFAPQLCFVTAHPSADGYGVSLEGSDLVITTYGSVGRLAVLKEKKWDLIILDEAQAIKNPKAQQTQEVKKLKALHRLVLTGTPIENHLGDLWSLFDFVSPGLLGKYQTFQNFFKKKQSVDPLPALKNLVSPYILRRLKTDKSVIKDLPDKIELKTYCLLSPQQKFLYQASVESMAEDLEKIQGIQRRGIVLSYLMKFKQICNHPSHFLKDQQYIPSHSGKFEMLIQLCQMIKERHEKVLIFTQFRDLTDALSIACSRVFEHPGLILHGGVPISKRQKMVEQFQDPKGPSYFVLSLKAGGVGLNLTEASYVIHFDRWWNPAVENQATDRAFRIGQTKKVLVHKMICKGTLEEKIDDMLESKKALSRDLLEEGSGNFVTELSNEALMKLVTLDIDKIG